MCVCVSKSRRRSEGFTGGKLVIKMGQNAVPKDIAVLIRLLSTVFLCHEFFFFLAFTVIPYDFILSVGLSSLALI